MFVRVWEYDVPDDQVDGFVAAYGPTGEWARLFARSEGFVRTEVYRRADGRNRFITVDTWGSRAAWQAFLDRWGSAYAALDEALEPLAAGGTLVVEGSRA